MIVGQSMFKARIITKFLKGQRWHSYLYPVLEGVGVGGWGGGKKPLNVPCSGCQKESEKKNVVALS